jgi:hypothetical protein
MLKRVGLLSFLLSSVGSDLLACAVCFGSADSNLREGFTWGILLLGSLPFLMLTAFIFSVVRSSRKHHRMPQ